MDKKEYLSKTIKIEDQIRVAELMVEEYRLLYKTMSTSIVESPNGREEALKWKLKAEAEEKRLCESKLLLQNLKLEIVNSIDKIPDTDLRLVLMYHYVERLSWAQIQKKMYLSKSTVLRLHKKALEALSI